MKEIGVIADRHTATCFKLGGLRNVFSADDPAQAQKAFSEIVQKSNLRILLVSEQILNKVKNVEAISAQQYPLIIPIPTLLGREPSTVDFMAELIKQKTGIEVKL